MKKESNSKDLGALKSFRIQSYDNLQRLGIFYCGSTFFIAPRGVVENDVIDYLHRKLRTEYMKHKYKWKRNGWKRVLNLFHAGYTVTYTETKQHSNAETAPASIFFWVALRRSSSFTKCTHIFTIHRFLPFIYNLNTTF